MILSLFKNYRELKVIDEIESLLVIDLVLLIRCQFLNLKCLNKYN